MTDPDAFVYSVPEKISPDGVFLIKFRAGDSFYYPHETYLLYDKRTRIVLNIDDLVRDKKEKYSYWDTKFNSDAFDTYLSGIIPADDPDGIRVFVAKELPYEASESIRRMMLKVEQTRNKLEVRRRIYNTAQSNLEKLLKSSDLKI